MTWKEAVTETRLRRAKESLDAYRNAENEARQILAEASASTKRAREKYEELFIAEEKRAYAQAKGGVQ